MSAPFTIEDTHLRYPSGEAQPRQTTLTGTGRATLTFVWQEIPLTGLEGWTVASARYVFD